MKKETLEEVSERLVPEAGCELNNSEALYWQQGWISGHIEGAKWMQERSYSEEKMIDLIQFLSMNEEFNGYCSVSKETAKHFLKQFKKK